MVAVVSGFYEEAEIVSQEDRVCLRVPHIVTGVESPCVEKERLVGSGGGSAMREQI